MADQERGNSAPLRYDQRPREHLQFTQREETPSTLTQFDIGHARNQIQIVGTVSGYLRPLKCSRRGILRRYLESKLVGANVFTPTIA